MNLLAFLDTLTRLGPGLAGIATGGTAGTLVDTARTEVNDFWNGQTVFFTSGPNAGLARAVTDFVAAADTIWFDSNFPNAVASGHRYVILPATGSEVSTILNDLGRGTNPPTADGQLGSVHSKFRKALEYVNTSVKVSPAAAAGVTVTAGAAGLGNKGVYTQIHATATIATKHRVTAICVNNPSALDDFELDLAQGAAAAEVVISTHRFSLDGVNDSVRIEIPSSIEVTGPNTRLAARISSTAGATTADVCIEYIDTLT